MYEVKKKMIKEQPLNFKGKIKFRNYVTLPGGRTITLHEWTKHNLITNQGKTLFARRIGGDTHAAITHMAIGTGSTAPAAGNTILQTETTRLTCTNVVDGYSTVFSAIFSSAQINTTTEVGLFNAASGGTLACRAVYSPISVPGGTNMAIDYTVTVGV